MWGKVSCLRKQHNGRDWVSNHRPSDLKSNALTTTPPRLGKIQEPISNYYDYDYDYDYYYYSLTELYIISGFLWWPRLV